MKRYKRLIAIIMAVLMVLSLAACGKKDTPAPKDDAAIQPSPDEGTEDGVDTEDEVFEVVIPEVNPDLGLEADSLVLINDVQQVLDRPHEIKPGSVFTFCFNDAPAYQPWNATAEAWLVNNIYEGLVYRYMGRADDIRPLIAESWTHSEDHLTWTYTIRKGVKFTDGTVCDAAAIAESWNFYYEIYPWTFSNTLKINSWEATGEYELTVHLSSPCGLFESGVSELFILSPTALAEFGAYDNRSCIGTAPYYVAEYTMGEGFIFKANPDYYLYERLPVIETIVCEVVYDNAVKMEKLLAGENDYYSTSSVKYYNELLSSGFDGTSLQGYGNSNTLFLRAGLSPALEIYEVRKAINRFIDLEAMNEVLYGGMGRVQTSIWAENTSGCVPWPEGFYYDLEEGRALLAEAGIDSEELKISTMVGSYMEPTFEIISEQLALGGIDLEVGYIQPESSYMYLDERTLELGYAGYKDNLPHYPWTFLLMPDALLRAVWSDLYDPELYVEQCSVYEAMLSAPTWDEMVAHSRTLTDLVQRDYNALPGVQSPYFALFRNDLKGIVMITEDHVLLWNYLYY